MHRARLVLNKLNPIIPNAGDNVRFGTWLLRQNVSKIAVSPQTKYYSAAAAAEPFLNGSSSAYVEEMYNAWLADPKSVHVVCICSSLVLCILISVLIIVFLAVVGCFLQVLLLRSGSWTGVQQSTKSCGAQKQ